MRGRLSFEPISSQKCLGNACGLTHWGRVTHICVGKLTIIGSDNGLSPGRHQAIIWTNAGILSIGPLGTNFNEILIGFQTFSFKKMPLKVSSAKWRPCCLGLNVLTANLINYTHEMHWKPRKVRPELSSTGCVHQAVRRLTIIYREISKPHQRCLNCCIVLLFGWFLHSTDTETPVQ